MAMTFLSLKNRVYSTLSTLIFPGPSWRTNNKLFSPLPNPSSVFASTAKFFNSPPSAFQYAMPAGCMRKSSSSSPITFIPSGAIANTKIGFPLFPDFFSILPVALSCNSIVPSAPATTNVLPSADKLKSNGSSKPASAVYSSFPFRSYART